VTEFLNWVQHGSGVSAKYWYLTYDHIYKTPRGEILQLRWPGDGGFAGHAAIRSYFELDVGFSTGCSDFSTPDKFPLILAGAIKEGQFRGVGISTELLTKEAAQRYSEKEDDDRFNLFWDMFSIIENRAEAWR